MSIHDEQLSLESGEKANQRHNSDLWHGL